MVRRVYLSAALSILAACGDDSSSTGADAAIGVDAVSDAAPDGGSKTRVTVTLDGTPVGGASVVVHDPQGEPTATVMTGTDGAVELAVVDGGLVTVVTPAEDAVRLVTIADVHVGDEITVPLRSATRATVATATLTTLTTHAGASLYTVSNGCNLMSAGLGPYPLRLTSACSAAGTYELFLSARTPSAQIAWAHGTYATSETAPAMPAWSTALTPYAVDLTHVPADVTNVNFFYDLLLTVPGRFGVVDGSRTPSSDTISVPVSLPTGLTGAVAAGYYATRSNGSRIIVKRLRAAGDVPATMALNDPALPELSASTITWPSAQRPRMSWTQTGTPAEGIVIRLGGDHGDAWLEWEAILPATATSFDFPALPPSLSFGLVETDDYIETAIGLIDLPGTVSAAAFRATALRWVHGWIFGYEEREPFELRIVELQTGS